MQERFNPRKVISRHRLPRFYRITLTLLWLAPATLLTLAILLTRGLTLAIFDPRYLLLAALMALPALYVWREGIDVTENGLMTRVFVPRYFTYTELGMWDLHRQHEGRILTVWDTAQQTVFQYHAAHITGVPVLVEALSANLRRRGG